MIAHQYPECGMGRYRQEHPHDGDLVTLSVLCRIGDIKNILERGKTHTGHHTVHDAVKRFIKTSLGISIQPEYGKFAKLFCQCYHQKGHDRLIQYPFSKITRECLFNKKGRNDAENAQHKTQ